jgi:chaperone required for assembly of F1-ATPase
VAAEWRAQTEVVDPGTMPLTRLVNTIIDGVATSAPAVAEDVAKFLASDLVAYRAEGPEVAHLATRRRYAYCVTKFGRKFYRNTFPSVLQFRLLF